MAVYTLRRPVVLGGDRGEQISGEFRNSPVKDAPECSEGLGVVGLLILFKSFKDQAEICECPRCRSKGHYFAVIVDAGCGTMEV